MSVAESLRTRTVLGHHKVSTAHSVEMIGVNVIGDLIN